MSGPLAGTLIRPLSAADAQEASRLVGEVFSQHVAPAFLAEGVTEFLSYASAESLARRLASLHVGFVAESAQGELIGVVEIRDSSHISLLFVSGKRQRRGIGKALVAQAVAYRKKQNPALPTVTVNASPNSVAAYESFGFVPTGPEQQRNAIRFIPMSLSLLTFGGA